MGRQSLKTLCGHISDISKLRSSLWCNLDHIQKLSRRAKSPNVCEDCGGIEVVEGEKNAEKMTDTVVKTVRQQHATNGIQQEPDTYTNPSEKYIKEIETNQPQRIVSRSTNSDVSNLKNDVTKSFESEEDCGCKEAEKNRLTGGPGKPPDPPSTKKLEPIKVDMACLRLNNEQKIVLDQGIVGMHDCKLTKRKYEIKKFIWKNKANNTEIEVITLGATVTRMVLPDRNGMLKDILLGFDCHEDHIKNAHYYMGSMIGRCANMISNPIFQFDGVCSNLSINRMKKYHFNGGCSGFNKYVWHPYVCNNKVIFSHHSKDGSEGYPGELLTTVAMELTPKNQFVIDIKANTTDPTICNLTNRLLFNLSSHAGGSSQLRRHLMHVNSDSYIGYDERGIPSCAARRTRDSEYDATCPITIHDIMKKWKNRDFRSAFVVNRATKQDCCLAARFVHEVSGRYLEVHTNQPIINIDFGYDLPRSNVPVNERLIGKCKVRYINNSSVCVQPQGYPDAINHKDFPTTILLPGEVYHNKISYEFGIVDKTAYGPVKTIEICEKVKVQPDCCNKLEGDTVDFTCDKDLYCREKDEQYTPPPPMKPKDRCC
ncbi:galactose mutarotase-like isoform X2 [Chrysoperla carnea]|uniref:galactose mutarotase-like isoform X2 n=1 Tax=Chrysoperla carnea TaxID=189513 RepID=UPI001D068E7D|nr:galactose mutarotase-like isoform X2 [Chrysoperla carnea]